VSGTRDDRSGTIHVNLPSGWQTADGSIVIEPNQVAVPIVALVVRDHEVEGTLAAYQDPRCDCAVRTTFHGEIIGDSINGAFEVTQTTRGTKTRGTWEVRRQVGSPGRDTPHPAEHL
jgi:hypothetical protein